jgi:vitamin B12 transporter
MFIRLFLSIFLSIFISSAYALENCKWNNQKGIPCLVVSKTNNTSKVSKEGVNKVIITKQDIENSGHTNITDILKSVSGLNVYQNGGVGQSSTVFMRGSESNHTLVMLNGIAINDQSVTDGLHDFGQDFVQSIQQIEVYKGSSGAHFGPSAIAGAINFVTAIDYTNTYSVSGFDDRNNSTDVNYTKITDNGWHLNINGTTNQSNLHSVKPQGTENDGTLNKQINLSSEKWINDNTKIKSTLYVRETRSYYDDYGFGQKGELGYVMDNTMQAFQTSFDRVDRDIEDLLTFHWQAYAKQIDDGGFSDSYDSQALVTRYEKKINSLEKLSFGFGSEYKYDWGAFINEGASFNSATRGHVKDFAVFVNAGYKILDNSIISFYGRKDDHNTAGRNNTYKINLLQKVNDNFNFGASTSTGLRNPSLYELFGSNNFGYKGNINLKAEKSKTNEIYASYNFLDNFTLSSTAYRTSLSDRLEFNSSFTAVENKIVDLNHDGLENELKYEGRNHDLSIFADFSTSKTLSGQKQLRRPDTKYGLNFSKKFIDTDIGDFNMNLNYIYTGEHLDFNSSTVVAKDTNILDLNILKDFNGSIWSLSVTNLLNERYQKPLTFNTEGRQYRIGFKNKY